MDYKHIHYSQKKVTIMGLGLHGGGLNSALFFAKLGANVTITDLKTTGQLTASIAQLKDYPIRYVLGKHEAGDFTETDLVIKNPAVPDTSPFLQMAKNKGIPIETDLSIFLRESTNPVIAVTGSKGKSTTSSAIAYGLRQVYPQAKLGGNITISPLTFLDDLAPDTPVVLELSSWQLADLKGKNILNPLISLITHIMPDHLNRYDSMADYVKDKQIIYQEQKADRMSLFNLDDEYQKNFPLDTNARCFFFSAHPLPPRVYGAHLSKAGDDKHGGYLVLPDSQPVPLLPTKLAVPGEHNRMNMLAAGLALALFGIKDEIIYKVLGEFKGIEHRLEFVRVYKGIKFYNDSAATIPQATMAAIKAFAPPLFLITGGTDKNLDFTPFKEVAHLPQEIYLLKGSATLKLIGVLDESNRTYRGPFDNLTRLMDDLVKRAPEGTHCVFSPGCASFELFLNEFDRGRKFKELVLAL